MSKETELARYSRAQTHRSYSSQFKVELVTAAKQPGASIAAIALQHGMNANVLHRWLKEHDRDGRHQLVTPSSSAQSLATSAVPAFVAVKLAKATTAQEPTTGQIKVELCKGAVSMTLNWPVSAAADLVQWSRAMLK